MVRVEDTHRYGVPVEQGFGFITSTANWPSFWPSFVRLEPGSSWGAVGDTARLVTRLLGRERELEMTITVFEPNRLVTYTSRQAGTARRSTRASLRARRRRIRVPARGRVRATRRSRGPLRPHPARGRDPPRVQEHLRLARARARRHLAAPRREASDGSEGDRRPQTTAALPCRYTPAGTPASASVTCSHGGHGRDVLERVVDRRVVPVGVHRRAPVLRARP